MKKLLLFLLFITLIFSQQCNNGGQATSITFGGASKYGGKNMDALACNENTNIDFTFGSAAAGTLTLNAPHSLNYLTFNSPNVDSHLQFLDVDGNNRSYSLKGISLVPIASARVQFDLSTYATHEISFTFAHQNGNLIQDTILVVYLAANDAINQNATNVGNIIPVSSTTPNGVQAFRTLVGQVSNIIGNNTSGDITQLSTAFLPFKSIDYAKFYTVQTQNSDSCKTNFLISAFVYNVNTTTINVANSVSYTRQASTQSTTGNLLCYGSHTSGVFQTHMRQSYPLWAAWFGALFFWCAILFAEHNTVISLYDRKFQQNKWTSWEMYSLWHLAHEQYFTRMMRTTAVYVCFNISNVVIACLYGQLGVQFPDPITILWMGVIGGVFGYLFSFVLGFFLQGYYNWTLEKYNIKKKIKALQSKQSMEAQTYEGEIDKCEDKSYTYYYWYYVFSVIVMFVCWAISVHEMQKLPRQNYFQMWYWVGSICLAFVFHVFVISPIMTAIFGSYGFYQYRGFWYNYDLGQSFKQVQD